MVLCLLYWRGGGAEGRTRLDNEISNSSTSVVAKYTLILMFSQEMALCSSCWGGGTHFKGSAI